jgi:RNA:NAD 2'-phosphotransferase (TPT1/KptA family)
MPVLAAIDLLLALLDRAAAISAKIAAAQAENRPLSDSEWAAIVEDDDKARAELEAAIARAKEEGR